MLILSRGTNRGAALLGASVAAPVPAASAEITIKRSVFRAEVFYTDNAQEAKETVKRQKERYRDARYMHLLSVKVVRFSAVATTENPQVQQGSLSLLS